MMLAFTTPPRRPARPGGFTMVELLTVLAVIGILATIIVPVIGSVRRNAKINQSKVLFENIASAMESYKAEYGRYPLFSELGAVPDPGTGDAGFFLNGPNGLSPVMRKVLTGDPTDTTGVVKKYNPRLKSFLSLGDTDLGTNVDYDDISDAQGDPPIVDAFRNRDIVVIINISKQGQINTSTFAGFPAPSKDTGEALAPTVAGKTFPQRIAIYSLAEYNKTAGTPLFLSNWDYNRYSTGTP